MDKLAYNIFSIIELSALPIASIIYRYISGKPFFYKFYPEAIYAEKWRSGHACNIFQMFGGARNCLWLTILKDEIIIRPHFPFNLLFLPEVWGCEHCIKGKDLISIDDTPKLGGIVIHYKKRDRIKKFRIYPKHKEIFAGFAKGILNNHNRKV